MTADVLFDDDLQLALWICYELHFDGFDEIDGDVEWDANTIAFRTELEALSVTALRERVLPLAASTYQPAYAR